MLKIKKYFIALLACITGVLLGLFAFACVENQDAGGEARLAFQKESTVLFVGEEETLGVEYTGNKALSWATDKNGVVELNNGVVRGVAFGTCVVTVSDGELSASCEITVTSVEAANEIEVRFANQNVNLIVGASEKITYEVMLGGIALGGVEFEYKSLDENVATVDGSGVITAKAVGKASVLATATIEGEKRYYGIEVTVTNGYTVEIDQNLLTAYTPNGQVEYPNIVSATAKVLGKNGEVSNAQLRWSSSDENVFTVNESDGTVTGVHKGKARLTVEYACADGTTVSDSITVEILPYTVELTASVVLNLAEYEEGYPISKTEMGIPAEANIEAVKVLGNGLTVALRYEEGVVHFGTVGAGEKDIYFEAGDVLYVAKFELWTEYIREPSQMLSLLKGTAGWYKICADIDMSGVKNYYTDLPTIFSGVLDGGNYTVSNFALNGRGLFDTVSANAQIKNLKLINVTLTSSDKNGVIANTVTGGTNVVVDNVTIRATLKGSLAGGVFGYIANGSAVRLDNCRVQAYSATASEKFGGIVACCASSSLTMENTKLYSALNACGLDENLYNSISVATALNATEGLKIAPRVETNAVEPLKDASFTVEADADNYWVAGLSWKKISEDNIIDRRISLPLADINLNNGECIEVLLENNSGEIIKYYRVPVKESEVVELSQDNFELIQYVKGGTVKLTGDIDLTGIAWIAGEKLSAFNGTFDGQGHVIKGLVTVPDSANSGHSSGLFNTFAGTFKNVYIVDVAYRQYVGGVVAKQITGDSTFENVYISLTEKKDGNVFGAFAYLSNGASLTFKNVYVQAPVMNDSGFGHLISYGTSTVTLDNVHLVGGKGKPVGYRDGYSSPTVDENAYKAYDSVAEVMNNVDEVGDFIKFGLENYGNILYITQENASEMFTHDSGYIVLREDIDLTAYNSALTAFQGKIDGQGHSIRVAPREYETTRQYAGLYYQFNGEISNLAVIITNLKDNMGGLAYLGAIELDNVFIQIEQISVSSNYSGAIFRGVALGAIKMKNVVIDMPQYSGTNCGFLCGFSQGEMDLAGSNSYFIGGNGQFVGLRDGYITNDKITNGTVFALRTEFAVESVLATLTSEMNAWYQQYLLVE